MLELPSILQAVVRWLRGVDAGCFEVVLARMSRCLSLALFATFLTDLLSLRPDRLVRFARPAPPVSALSYYLCHDDQYSRPGDHLLSYNHAHQKKKRARAGASGPHGSSLNMLTGQGETTARSQSPRWLLLVLVLCTHRSTISTVSFLPRIREARIGFVLLPSLAFTSRAVSFDGQANIYRLQGTSDAEENRSGQTDLGHSPLSPIGESVLLRGPSHFTARSTTLLPVRPAFHPNNQALQPAHLARPVRGLEADQGALVGPSDGSSAADAGPMSVERGGEDDET
jgi:hypothetical protein